MGRPKKVNRVHLVHIVKQCKKDLNDLSVQDAKNSFFNKYYETMKYSDFNRLNNLWSCRITEVVFTNNLEEFVKQFK